MIATPKLPQKTPPRSTGSGAGLAAMICWALFGPWPLLIGGGVIPLFGILNAQFRPRVSDSPVDGHHVFSSHGQQKLAGAGWAGASGASSIGPSNYDIFSGSPSLLSILAHSRGFCFTLDHAAETAQLLCCFVFHDLNKRKSFFFGDFGDCTIFGDAEKSGRDSAIANRHVVGGPVEARRGNGDGVEFGGVALDIADKVQREPILGVGASDEPNVGFCAAGNDDFDLHISPSIPMRLGFVNGEGKLFFAHA